MIDIFPNQSYQFLIYPIGIKYKNQVIRNYPRNCKIKKMMPIYFVYPNYKTFSGFYEKSTLYK